VASWGDRPAQGLVPTPLHVGLPLLPHLARVGHDLVEGRGNGSRRDLLDRDLEESLLY
jgi:hypothetical protein